MKRIQLLTLVVLVLIVFAAAACSGGGDDRTGMPNPASVYCEEQGGTLELRDTDEGQIGICVFDDGSECEEWAFYRDECGPGEIFP